MKDRYTMVIDTEHTVDGIDYDSFEAAKVDAIDTLIIWMTDYCTEEKCSTEMRDWTEEQIEGWDSMICNCSVEVRDKKKYNEKDFGLVWKPSYKDEEEIGWLLYEDLVKKQINV